MGRIFVCDAACVLPFGHNVSSLKYFSQELTSGGNDVVALCCRYLPRHLVEKNGFEPFFRFYYPRYLDVPTAVLDQIPLDTGAHFDRFEAIATEDARELLRRWDVTSDDRIFLPSADFYTVIGLLNAFKDLSVERRPSMFIRFIGVMENATATYPAPLEEMLYRLRVAYAAGLPLRFGAEVPKNADYLAEKLGVFVAVTPYPHVGELLPLPGLGPFVMFCPGAARADKGYFLLHEVFEEVRRRDASLSIRFVTQVLSDHEAKHQEVYTSKLYAMPGVELLPASLTFDEIMEQYRRCHAVLLPYDAEVYAYRGSAVMMESAYLGRQIVTLGGTGFADQVRYYGLGTVVPSTNRLADAILAMAQIPRATLAIRSKQARERFHFDSANLYRRWLGLA